MPSAQRPPGVPGRLWGGDLVATLLVAAAVVVSTLWLTDVALPAGRPAWRPAWCSRLGTSAA